MPSETLHWAQSGGPNKPLSLTRRTVSSATRFVQQWVRQKMGALGPPLVPTAQFSGVAQMPRCFLFTSIRLSDICIANAAEPAVPVT